MQNRPGAYLPMDGTDIFRPASRSGRFEERCGLARGIGCLRSVGDVCAVGRGADFVQTCRGGAAAQDAAGRKTAESEHDDKKEINKE